MNKSKFNKPGMWVVRDQDGFLYICNSKPWKNFYSEHPEAFTWECEGDFMRLYLPHWSTNFANLKLTDNPVEANVDYFHKKKETAIV